MIDPGTDGWKQRESKGFMANLGPLWSRREGDEWAYGVIADDTHVNVTGVIHGGMLVSLADQAMSMVVWEAMERTPCVTIQLDTQFLSAARPGDFIQARSRVIRKTRSLVFVQGTLEVDGEAVLAATGIWKAMAPRA
jgi:uncharacterized protein (TIGR00369 family)